MLGSPRLALARMVLGAALGVVAAGFSLAQIVRGLRPLWLPTWLAMVSLIVPGLLVSLLVPASDREHWLSNNGMIVLFAGLGLVTLLAVWRIPRWRWWVIGLAVASTCPNILQPRLDTTSFGSAPWYVISFLGAATLPALIAMPIFFARGVFEKAPFGNAMHASLFLLALFTLAFPLDSARWGAQVWAVSKLLSGAAVVWAARTPRRRDKSGVICIAVALWALGGVVSGWGSCIHTNLAHIGLPVIISLFCAASVPWFLMTYLVLYPIRCEERMREPTPPLMIE